MKPGPSPKPTKLKKLAGNPGRRPLNDAEPEFPVPGRMLNVPDFLGTEAAEVWRDLGKLLLDAGLFTVVDKFALAMFCSSAGYYIKAERVLQKQGPIQISETTGNAYWSQWFNLRNKMWEQMRQMFGEFGLTPAERSRLRVAIQDDDLSLGEQLFKLALGDDD